MVSPAGVPGDYNNNGAVDAADFVLWRKGGPLLNDPTPGNQPGDYDYWRARFGNAPSGGGAGVGNPASVPEPANILPLILAGSGLLPRRRAVSCCRQHSC
jgi:hypothetical protein